MGRGEFFGNAAKVGIVALLIWVKGGPALWKWTSGLGDRTRAAVRAFGEDPTPAPAPLVPLGRFPGFDANEPAPRLGGLGGTSTMFPRPFDDGRPRIAGSRSQPLIESLRPATTEATPRDEARSE